METILSNPFVQYLLSALAWGPPYWPEVGTGLTLLLMALWLAYRTQKRGAAKIPSALPPPSPQSVRETEEIYEEARAEIKTEAVPSEELPPPEVSAPPVEEAEEEFEAEAKAALETPPPAAEVEAPPIEEEAEPMEEAPPTEDFFTRLRRGLSRTKEAFVEQVDRLLKGARLDDDTIEELEEVMVTADMGVKTAYKLLDKIQSESGKGRLKSPNAVRDLLREEVTKILTAVEAPLNVTSAKPYVIMVLGVNGVGKTTTIGKIAWRYRKEGKKVLIAAADTFRAAAIDQLKLWGGRIGAEVVAKDVGADPAGVAYEALERARAEGKDVLLIDTAGRLQNKSDLMAELAKIVRVLKKLDDSAPHGVLLVLDATTGQNALAQVEVFKEIAGVTGLVVTKLDGTARGGILVAIAERYGIPINAIGIGEGIDDLEPFDADSFARAIAGLEAPNEQAA